MKETNSEGCRGRARAVIKVLFLQGKAPKGIHVILTETLACFLPGWAKDLSVYIRIYLFVIYLINNTLNQIMERWKYTKIVGY